MANPLYGQNKADTGIDQSSGTLQRIGIATTLTAADSGNIFMLDAASTLAVTLPSVAVGLQYHFIVADSTAVCTIGAGSAIILGNLEQQSDTNENNRVACAGVSNVIIGTTALQGDSISFVSDGVKWYVVGHSSIQTAVSTS